MRRTTRREDEARWDWHLASNRIHFSPAWLALIGYQDHELGTAPDEWFARVHPEDAERLRHGIDAARGAPGTPVDLRYRLRHKDGTYRWMHARASAVAGEDGNAPRLTGTQIDVTPDVVTDPTTGLPNRLLLVDRLAQSIGRATRQPSFHYALLLVDIGRPAGPQPASWHASDALLNAAARRLETCLRLPGGLHDQRESDLVARAEGDRIAVLLDGISEWDHARLIAEHMLAELGRPLRISGRDVRLSPGIGVSLSASGYERADDALRDAETALHRARVLGGSHCEVFDAQVLHAQQGALQLERDLDLALQRSEFELLYQPIVSLAATTPVGFEALVRWRHPTFGVVSPVDFISIAERTGAIVPLGRWILRQVCRQIKEWDTAGAPTAGFWVSVNVSGVQLREPDFAEQVAGALRENGLDPRRLVLELTEGVAMHDPGAARALLMQLRADGVRISIDDFGTGYSSLAYLRQLPVDGVKIDQSFVRRLGDDQDTAVIVAAIMTMANDLGLSVVAEGVETETQRARLEGLACTSAQGYLFAQPLSADDALAFLQRQAPGATQPGAAADGAPALGAADRPGAPLLMRMGRGAVAAGAMAIVVACAGVGALLYRSESRSKAERAAPAAAAPISTESARPAESPAAASAAAAHATTPAPGGRAGASSPVTPGGAVAVDAAGAPQTFPVIHLHRLGECRGRLILSQREVAFTADKESGDDAFTWKAGTFTHDADGKTVTIRTDGRTYRFESAAESSAARPRQIARISTALARVKR